MSLWKSRFALFVALRGGGEEARADGFAKPADRLRHRARPIPERPDELRMKVHVETQQILQNQNLTVAIRARADADLRNPQRSGNALRKRRGNALENHRKRAATLQRLSLTQDVLSALAAAALHPEAAVRMKRLRLQAKMPHDGNAALHEPLNCVFVSVDAFEFHGVRARAHQNVSRIERCL